jgi:hypothetical protein
MKSTWKSKTSNGMVDSISLSLPFFLLVRVGAGLGRLPRLRFFPNPGQHHQDFQMSVQTCQYHRIVLVHVLALRVIMGTRLCIIFDTLCRFRGAPARTSLRRHIAGLLKQSGKQMIVDQPVKT